MHTPLTLVARGRRWIAAVLGLSFLVNVLMLTGPMYMLQVYDRVLSSRSIDTLIVLSIIMAALFVFMGIFDHLRARVLARVGLLWMDAGRLFLQGRALPVDKTRKVVRDCETAQRSFAHPAMLGALDIIWMPLFLAALFFLHPLLAGAAVLGMAISLGLSLAGPASTQASETQATKSLSKASSLEQGMERNALVLESLGSVGRAREQWLEGRKESETLSLVHADAGGAWQTATKTFRMFFQSVLLGVGAYLAVRGDLTPGAMIAGSILGGRALAPFDQLLSGLGVLRKGHQARAGLRALFVHEQSAPAAQVLPETPKALLETTGVVYRTADRPPLLHDLRFRIEPQHCLAIFGASGSGKSAALRVMSGAWRPSAGVVLFDSIPLEDWPEARRAQHIGHLGQDAFLPEGTIGDIIRGFQDTINTDAVIAAATTAGIHASIIALPNGYMQAVEQGGLSLPHGLRRGILRAQVLCANKTILCLDDPSAGLDGREIYALTQELRQRLADGAAIAMASNDPDMLRLSTHALVLEKGRVQAYGPIATIVDEYAKDLAKTGKRDRIPAGLLPAVVRRLPAPQRPDSQANDPQDSSPASPT